MDYSKPFIKIDYDEVTEHWIGEVNIPNRINSTGGWTTFEDAVLGLSDAILNYYLENQ
jgi:hypothetical protein